jgi:hypothetical protein
MIKKSTLLLLFIASQYLGYAQAIFENFEWPIFPPVGWASYSKLSGNIVTARWTTSSTAQSGLTSAFLSWQSSPSGLKDDYLVSHAITPTTTSHLVKFYQKVSFPNNDGTNFNVGVSTDTVQANAISSYSSVYQVYDFQIPYQGFIQQTIDLSNYIGQTIVLVFHVNQFNNGDNWFIDNITTDTTTLCKVNTTINQSICQGGSYSFNNQVLTTAGAYNDTLTSAVGCDSIITLNLSVNTTSTNITQSICLGSSYFFNGQNLNTAGTYADTLFTAGGCDTVINLNLEVNQLASTINHSLCPGESFSFDGQVLNTNGVYVDTFINGSGCDSIVTLYLMNKPAAQANPTNPVQDICGGNSVSLDAGLQIPVNNACYFNGTTNYVNAGIVTEFNGAEQFTLEAMVQSNSNTLYKTIFARRQGNSNGFSLQFDYTVVNNGLLFLMGAGTGYAMAYTPANSFSSGVWHHVAAVYNGTGATNADKIKIYIDGVSQILGFITGGGATAMPSSNQVHLTLPLIIGSESTSPASNINFQGYLDDVRVWNVARTDSQIAASNNTCLNIHDNDGLVIEYNFNEPSNVNSSTFYNNARPLYNGTLNNSYYNLSNNSNGCILFDNATPFLFNGTIGNYSTVFPTDSTVYTGLVASQNGCVDSAVITVNVNKPPVNQIVSSSIYACANSGYRLSVDLNSPLVYMYWRDSTGGYLVGGPVYDVNPSIAAKYSIYAYGVNGCVSSDSITILPDNGNINIDTSLGITNVTLEQSYGSTLRYTDENCNTIVKIKDIPGSFDLGEVLASVSNLPTAGTYNGQAYVRKVYHITPENQGDAIITLYYTQADFDDYNANNGSDPDLPTGPADSIGKSNIRLSKVSGGTLGLGTASVLVPDSVVWNPITNAWELQFTIPNFSEFYLHGANPSNASLAVELLSFTGESSINANNLFWSLHAGTDVKTFLVQHSVDGKTFATIQTIEANHNSTQSIQYNYVHQYPKEERNFYRLQLVSPNQQLKQSETIEIISKTNNESIKVFPNPAKDVIFVSLQSSRSNTTIQILEVSGQVIKEINIDPFKVSAEIHIADLASGTYLMQVNQGNRKVSTQKLIKL